MLAAYDAKLGTQGEVARMFDLNWQCLSELLRRRRQTGVIAPGHGWGHPPAYSGRKLEQLRRPVQEHPDATLAQLREQTSVRCSLVVVHNALLRLNPRFKKRAHPD